MTSPSLCLFCGTILPFALIICESQIIDVFTLKQKKKPKLCQKKKVFQNLNEKMNEIPQVNRIPAEGVNAGVFHTYQRWTGYEGIRWCVIDDQVVNIGLSVKVHHH